MMKMSSNDYISDQSGFGCQTRQVFEAESCLRDLFFIEVERFVLWRFNYWLSEWLSILIHDQCLDTWPVYFLRIRVVLLVFMQHNLESAFPIFLFLILVVSNHRRCTLALTVSLTSTAL